MSGGEASLETRQREGKGSVNYLPNWTAARYNALYRSSGCAVEVLSLCSPPRIMCVERVLPD